MASDVSGLAERYALALYELADEAKTLDAVADDLRGLRQLLDESGDLRRLVRSPVFGRAQQAGAMAAVLDKAGAETLTASFVGVLANNRRLFALPEMITAYLAELARRRGEVTAHVSSAKKLTEKQVEALTAALRDRVGGTITLEQQVDKSLIGGLVVRVGSRMIDSSLKTKLARLELAMKGVA